MYILTPTSVENIVLAAPNRIQPGLLQSQLPNFVEEWKRPGKRMKWQDFFESLAPAYQNKARQDWYQYQQEVAARRAPEPAIEEPVAESPVKPLRPETITNELMGGPNPAPVGDPDAFGAGIPGVTQAPEIVPTTPAQTDPTQAIQALMQSARRFGSQFNNEIRAYNQHIKQVHQSIAMLQKIDWNTSTVDPDTVAQQASALQQTLDTATVEQAQDLAFLQRLATQATQLAQSAGGAGQTIEQAYQPQAPPQNLWQRIRGAMPGRASESNSSLTAEGGSAASLLQ